MTPCTKTVSIIAIVWCTLSAAYARERHHATPEQFWQDYSLADTTQACQDSIRKHFPDFLRLLEQADSTTADKAVASFISPSRATPKGKALLNELTEYHLGHPRSALRNDKTYAFFLKHIIAQNSDETEASRLRFLLGEISKNQPGTTANDLIFTTDGGKQGTLHKTPALWTVLYLSDPTCSTCHRLLPQALESPVMRSDSIQVIMVYPDVDKTAWDNSLHALPDEWLVTWAPHAREQYYLPALPALYLLDREKKVVLKDSSLEQFSNYLSRRAKRKAAQGKIFP